MKKIVLFFLMAVAFSTANAQVDSLQEYTGKYNFPEGSPVTEIGVIVESGVLTATSVMGNSELKKSDTKDVFELVAYSGLASFKRNEDGKIIGLFIQVQDINMEGTKAEPVIDISSKKIFNFLSGR
ncbi:MAG: hypothetical protein KBF82_11655 [Chitinophagaceae bacterium]|nr:hypothetical protein [Chitinophagaceae bacterium]MBP9104514.1 hypothetical protein [Chitinophagaceae bacterium]